VETLLSTPGLLRSFSEAEGRPAATWVEPEEHIRENGIDPWLNVTPDAAAVLIAGALNILGLRRVVITGGPTELAPVVMECLSASIVKGAMWARFGKVSVECAPRRRIAGLVAAGIERLVLPKVALNRNAPVSVPEQFVHEA
jgi:predicted NBD/HSP70 family sugar kinase